MAVVSDGIASGSALMREAFILGDRLVAKEITTALTPLNFLQIRTPAELSSARRGLHFIVAICDFTNLENMQVVARILTKIDATDAHKIIYATEPATLDQQHLFFSIELGSRFTVSGHNKNSQLKDYIKRIVLGSQIQQSLTNIESELQYCYTARDDRGLQKIADRLTQFPKDNEEVLKLQAIASRHLRLLNKSVYYLRRLLTVNPQNLWAAGELGRMYLRSNRIAEGLEVLEKLSQFHDLNSERVLELGNAYLTSGRTNKAERAYTIGSKMIGSSSDDSRFIEGLAKVKVTEGDVQSALAILGRPTLSENVLTFINMRAILAIRNGQVRDGIRYYQLAIEGCHNDNIVRAKLYFNTGLALMKLKEEENAVLAFQKSLELGGAEFNRAKGPLDICLRSITKKQKNAPTEEKTNPIQEGQGKEAYDSLDEIELDDL